MPKIKADFLKVKGKLGDKVFVDSENYGYHQRAAPAPGLKKNEPAFKAQYSRTAYLNKIAGELNRIIKTYAGSLHSGNFYSELQKRLRPEPSDDIYLLLTPLKGLAVHPQYTVERFGPLPLVSARIKNKKINVRLEVADHPYVKKTIADCYYYELVFLCRSKNSEGYTHGSQLSEWLFMREGPAVFEFVFDAPAKPAQWVACLKIILGRGEAALNRFEGEGMGIAAVGSFLKEDVKKEKPALPPVVNKKEATAVIRVKKLGFR